MTYLLPNSSDALFGPAYRGPARKFDFTLLFEDTILTIVPATLFVVAASGRALWLTSKPNKVTTSFGRLTKLVLLSAFVTIQLTVLLARATNPQVGTRASVVAAAFDFAAAAVLFVLSCFEHSRSVTPSTLIGLYLIISLPFDAVRLRTFYLLRGYAAKSIAHLFSLSLAIKSAVLITEAVEKRSILLEPYRDLPPEATSGVYNRSFFWWLNPLLRSGFGTTLKMEDLYDLDQDLLSTSVEHRFGRAWATVKDPRRFSLLWTSASVLKWQLLLAACPRLLLVGSRYAQPFLVQETIQYVSKREGQMASVGWGLVGAYFLVYLTQAIFTAAYRHLQNRCVTQLRGGLISLLYNKTLELSIVSVDPSAALTLMSADVQRIVDPFAVMQDVWGGAVEVGLGALLLYLKLGSAVYAPAIVYGLAILGSAWVVSVISGFQKRWLNAVQSRVSFTSALLHSMRNVKLLGMSSIVKDRTQALREEEILECKAYRKVEIFQIIVQNFHWVLAPFATFLHFYLRSRQFGEVLDLASAFSILTIFSLVSGPFNAMLWVSPQLASALSCFERIQQYLLSNSRHDNRLSFDMSIDDWGLNDLPGELLGMRQLGAVSRIQYEDALTLKSCSFSWKEDGSPVVDDVDLSVRNGCITMIIGPVGCGKSTLLKGILSETPQSRGFVYRGNQSIAFADQEPWIQNGTIRDAIRGLSSDENSYDNDPWYAEVIECCGLTEEISLLPKGDRTLIGSKGISLSGGQKQRLALARAVFARADILLLDDVFSGLDNDTEEHIFRKLFSRSGPLRRLRTTVILVTHAVHRLPYADLIVSMDAHGRVVEQGNYATLTSQNGYVHSLNLRFRQEPERPEAEQEPTLETSTGEQKVIMSGATVDENIESTEDLQRRTGEWTTYKHWFKSCGYVSTTLSVVWAFTWVMASQTPGVLVTYLGNSSSQATTFIIIFGLTCLILLGSIIALGCQIFLGMQPHSSSHLHLGLLETVLDAPLSFFTRTDIGTITNRFGQDMALVDSELPYAYADSILTSLECASGIGLMLASGSGYFAGTIPVVLVALYAIQKYYLRTSRQMRLLDLEAKAPLYTSFAETAAGLASIRAFGWTERFAERNLELLDRSQRPFYLMLCIQRWLGIVLDLLVAVLITILLVIIVSRRKSIDPGFVGLGLLSTINLSFNFTQLLRHWTILETSIGAVSRLRGFVKNTESEHKPWEFEKVGNAWPENGEVGITGFGASYSADSVLVLQDIGLGIRPNEKVGICGRSGSGKSSMLASLLHLLEFRSGWIQIDGFDISRIPRETLRASLNVIPQEPWWLTTASVRFNMDPWSATANPGLETPFERSQRDDTFISALKQCQVWHIILEKGGLDATMTPDFLSHGQRQLFCLARALVRKSKIVVLDEVSANVDVKTDELMQKIIREKFMDCTVIVVAHRLNTIVDFQRVVVLGKGEVVEVGNPAELLETEGSAFKGLYESRG